MSGRVSVFIACSLDGFIAAENDDLSWLPQPGEADPEDYGYASFMERVGAILMGRRTYEVVQGFGAWPYGELSVLVATTRKLNSTLPTVHAVRGSIEELVQSAQDAAEGKVVYLDGGDLIRQALDAGRIDAMTVSVVPVVLGRGIPLFAGVSSRHRLALERVRRFDSGLVQLEYRPSVT